MTRAKLEEASTNPSISGLSRNTPLGTEQSSEIIFLKSLVATAFESD